MKLKFTIDQTSSYFLTFYRSELAILAEQIFKIFYFEEEDIDSDVLLNKLYDLAESSYFSITDSDNESKYMDEEYDRWASELGPIVLFMYNAVVTGLEERYDDIIETVEHTKLFNEVTRFIRYIEEIPAYHMTLHQYTHGVPNTHGFSRLLAVLGVHLEKVSVY
jgi:hypothetical protein